MAAPVLLKPIPAQMINEQASFGPFDLKPFFQTDDVLHFQGELTSGAALPKGLICTDDGLLTGIPAKGTNGAYAFRIIAANTSGTQEVEFEFAIKLSFISGVDVDYFNELKSQIWQALEHKLPLPELATLNARPVSLLDVYYLMERFATLTIWDAVNLDGKNAKVALNLPEASPHFHIYDCGSLLVATPKDLFSHERTLKDALQTARAMAREVYRRGWIIEFAGFDKMERALWVELQHLEDVYGKKLEVLHYDPSFKELRIYTEEAKLGVDERVVNR